jgi:hypothetical protein
LRKRRRALWSPVPPAAARRSTSSAPRSGVSSCCATAKRHHRGRHGLRGPTAPGRPGRPIRPGRRQGLRRAVSPRRDRRQGPGGDKLAEAWRKLVMRENQV